MGAAEEINCALGALKVAGGVPFASVWSKNRSIHMREPYRHSDNHKKKKDERRGMGYGV
jgi:hypothetical protein